MSVKNSKMTDLAVEVRIAAPPADVWRALTDDIAAWWPEPFFAGGAPGKRRYLLEARPGGRMMEQWDDGGGVLWALVVGLEPGRRLQVTGFVFPNWGGPSQWFGTWELDGDGDGTRLSFSEHAIGRIAEDYLQEKTKGWNFLWAVLKAHLEGTEAPAWQD